ncbi:MAG: hypothetical protein ACREB1_08640 [Sphingomicrobium sp.]
MSMDLYLWKSPVTDDEEEARRLVDRYFDDNEPGVFEPSADIAAAADELLRLYPYWPVSGEDLLAGMSEEERGRYTEEGLAQLRESGSYSQGKGGPWADLPFEQSDNLLVLSIRWSAHDGVLDDIVRIGRERELVIYDPQGPSIYLPDDPISEDSEDPPPGFRDWLTITAVCAFLLALTYAAWLIPIGWIRWPAVIVAGFFALAGLFVLGGMIAAALGFIDLEEGRKPCAEDKPPL